MKEDFDHLFKDGNPFEGMQLEECLEGGWTESFYDCVQCGFCCTISACGYGKWNAEKHQCDFLTTDNKCAKYNEIQEREKNEVFPMMKCGCSSPLCNERREKKILDINKRL